MENIDVFLLIGQSNARGLEIQKRASFQMKIVLNI